MLIWLDQTFDEVRNSFHLFQSLINTIQFFSNIDHHVGNLSMRLSMGKLFIITSGNLGEILVPTIETKSQIVAIYVYCNQRKHHEEWAKDYSKVKGVYTDLRSIFNGFRRDFRQMNNDLIPIDHLPSEDSTRSFSCSLLLQEILKNIQSNTQMKKELIEYSRLHYQDNPIQLDLIDQYENSSYDRITAIEWYTRECFLSTMINQALRFYDIEMLNKTSFFIQDLNTQIKDLHAKVIDPGKVFVYYSQRISHDQLEKFRMNINGLISFNGFLLTTIEKELSLCFARQSGNARESISILYQIEIDRSKSSTSFASLNEFDYYHDTDQYILFSLPSIFRITHIEHLEENIWQINLLLIDLPRSTRKSKGFISLGQLLFHTNDLHKAKNIFQVLLRNSNSNNRKELITIHRMLGRIYQKNEDFTNALVHYQECLKIETAAPFISLTQASIGAILEKLGQLNQALEYFQRAIKYENIKPFLLVFYYISIGRIFYKQGDNIQARKYWILALKSEGHDHFLEEINHYLTILS